MSAPKPAAVPPPRPPKPVMGPRPIVGPLPTPVVATLPSIVADKPPPTVVQKPTTPLAGGPANLQSTESSTDKSKFKLKFASSRTNCHMLATRLYFLLIVGPATANAAWLLVSTGDTWTYTQHAGIYISLLVMVLVALVELYMSHVPPKTNWFAWWFRYHLVASAQLISTILIGLGDYFLIRYHGVSDPTNFEQNGPPGFIFAGVVLLLGAFVIWSNHPFNVEIQEEMNDLHWFSGGAGNRILSGIFFALLIAGGIVLSVERDVNSSMAAIAGYGPILLALLIFWVLAAREVNQNINVARRRNQACSVYTRPAFFVMLGLTLLVAGVSLFEFLSDEPALPNSRWAASWLVVSGGISVFIGLLVSQRFFSDREDYEQIGLDRYSDSVGAYIT